MAEKKRPKRKIVIPNRGVLETDAGKSKLRAKTQREATEDAARRKQEGEPQSEPGA